MALPHDYSSLRLDALGIAAVAEPQNGQVPLEYEACVRAARVCLRRARTQPAAQRPGADHPSGKIGQEDDAVPHNTANLYPRTTEYALANVHAHTHTHSLTHTFPGRGAAHQQSVGCNLRSLSCNSAHLVTRPILLRSCHAPHEVYTIHVLITHTHTPTCTHTHTLVYIFCKHMNVRVHAQPVFLLHCEPFRAPRLACCCFSSLFLSLLLFMFFARQRHNLKANLKGQLLEAVCVRKNAVRMPAQVRARA